MPCLASFPAGARGAARARWRTPRICLLTGWAPREARAQVWSRRFYVCAACVLMALALRLPVLRMAKPLGLDTGGKLGIGGVTVRRRH